MSTKAFRVTCNNLPTYLLIHCETEKEIKEIFFETMGFYPDNLEIKPITYTELD